MSRLAEAIKSITTGNTQVAAVQLSIIILRHYIIKPEQPKDIFRKLALRDGNKLVDFIRDGLVYLDGNWQYLSPEIVAKSIERELDGCGLTLHEKR